jgi:hypothetical protein
VPVAFAVLKQRLDIVIVQPRFVSHVSGFDREGAVARSIVKAERYRSQKVVEGVAERRSSGLAFTFHAATTSSSSVTVVRMLMALPG